MSATVARGRRSRIALWLGAMAAAMFFFGFALSPLYTLICNVTGMRTSAAEAPATRTAAGQAGGAAAVGRLVTVRFDTNVSRELAWEFKPLVRKVEVAPDRMTEVRFEVKNLSNETIVARAVPAVTPWEATGYFVKSECFCFREQTLKPGETAQLPLRFKVTAGLPAGIDALTLSYTFMRRDVHSGGATTPGRGGSATADDAAVAVEPRARNWIETLTSASS